MADGLEQGRLSGSLCWRPRRPRRSTRSWCQRLPDLRRRQPRAAGRGGSARHGWVAQRPYRAQRLSAGLDPTGMGRGGRGPGGGVAHRALHADLTGPADCLVRWQHRSRRGWRRRLPVAGVRRDVLRRGSGPMATQNPLDPGLGLQQRPRSAPSAAAVESAVAEDRLTPDMARASRSRAPGRFRATPEAASCPTTMPTNSSRRTLSRTPGSWMANVNRGLVNRKL